MRWLFLPLLVIQFAPGVAGAQTQASVGLGVGTVRYAGGSSLSVASITPGLQLSSPNVLATFGGVLAALPGSAVFLQGRGDVWMETPPVAGPFRLGAEGTWTGTTRSDNGWTAAVHGVGEVLWVRPSWGIGAGAGPSTGWISGDSGPSVTALHTRARLWWRSSETAPTWSVSVEPTRFLGAWFTDIGGSVDLARGPLQVTVWAVARTSRTYSSSRAASVLGRLALSPAVTVELGGGSYLRDPYQGFPQASFVTAGIRLSHAPRTATASKPTFPPLIPEVHGDTVTVRFQMPGAAAVAIAGDWNGWTPVALTGMGSDVWLGALRLRPGTYHFNLLVDGKDWVVPGGVATVPDGLGGIVGVLIVN
jgi:AMP-activated protein kinase-like protein